MVAMHIMYAYYVCTYVCMEYKFACVSLCSAVQADVVAFASQLT